MTITKTENGKEITLALEGRLDTNSAPELEKVLAEFGVYPQSLVLDFESLSYISSAGLRVLLSTQKRANAAQGTLVIRNANELIREVFEVTGFDNILTIED